MCTNTTKLPIDHILFTLSGVQNKAKLVKPQSQKYIPPSRNKHWFYMQAKCTNQMQKKYNSTFQFTKIPKEKKILPLASAYCNLQSM